MTTTLNIQGMHCVSCKALIEDVCLEIPGVASCNIDVETHMATIEHDASVGMDAIKREIEKMGEYKVSLV